MPDPLPRRPEGVLVPVLGPVLAAARGGTDGFGLAARWEGVPSAVAAARDGVDAVLRDRGLRRLTPELTTESLVRGAVSAAWLEGGRTEDDEARIGDVDDSTARAARVYGEVLATLPALGRSPLGVFARLHAVAAAGETADDRLGRPRDAAAAAVLGALSARLLAPTSASAWVVAALCHLELMTAQPFASRNALLACAIERAVLVGRGVDPGCVLVPEAGHWRQRYEERATGAQGTSAGAVEVRNWLLVALRGSGAAVGESPLTCERRPPKEDAAHGHEE